ncbi:GrpB family protein [Providencia stuartii]
MTQFNTKRASLDTLSPEDICAVMKFEDGDPNENPWVLGKPPTLNALGYVHTIREPSWYEHRMLYLDKPQVNLHVFAPGCPEHLRHQLFRDWLMTHPDDLATYAVSKMKAKEGVNTMMDYNQKKNDTIQKIYAKLFAHLQKNS